MVNENQYKIMYKIDYTRDKVHKYQGIYLKYTNNSEATISPHFHFLHTVNFIFFYIYAMNMNVSTIPCGLWIWTSVQSVMI